MVQAVTYQSDKQSVYFSRQAHCAGKPDAGTLPGGKEETKKRNRK